jgi:hypothetical protein
LDRSFRSTPLILREEVSTGRSILSWTKNEPTDEILKFKRGLSGHPRRFCSTEIRTIRGSRDIPETRRLSDHQVYAPPLTNERISDAAPHLGRAAREIVDGLRAGGFEIRLPRVRAAAEIPVPASVPVFISR